MSVDDASVHHVVACHVSGNGSGSTRKENSAEDIEVASQFDDGFDLYNVGG